ncbi:LysR family transcriptional regulator [Xinfangfangia sp. D13-10-4-6]|uniref:LysR family transcriptional regulator n=1 Tax=Pseudogemmobacter hezensis TaxID=2737662 RepID=UPI0015576222|nr:LysR family transcriptional regulator [Pseudogemmobacter hezensis]NPD16733.1 LysR family transcriptional regulator [Pseudogemmobacter hezensis]
MALRFTLRQLEYLVAVGDYGSVTEAAERVNVSAPSVSAAISQLEREFRITLFIRRHAHGLSLTEAGRSFVEHARRILVEASRLNTLSNEVTGQVRGPLNVACLMTCAQVVIPSLRRTFCNAYPEVDFVQYELDHAAIIEGLRLARFDLALTYDLDVPPDMEFHELGALPPHAVLHEGHPLAGRDSVSIEELAEFPMILLDLPYSAAYFLSLFQAAGCSPKIAERTRDIWVMRALVANRFGYSIANIRPAIDLALDGGRLIDIPLRGDLRPMRLGIVTMRGTAQSLSVRRFIEFCSEKLRDGVHEGIRKLSVGPDLPQA